MNRRKFVAALTALVAMPFLPLEGGRSLKVVKRYDYAKGTWSTVRMKSLRKGDVFLLGQEGVFRAASDPCYKSSDWGIEADVMVDSATGEWVSV